MTSIRDADFGLNVLKLSGRAVPRNRTVITVTRAAVIRSPQSYRLPLRVSQRTRKTADRVQFQPVCDGMLTAIWPSIRSYGPHEIEKGDDVIS